MSMKWKIFILVSFCFAALLIFLWLFQVEFLETFYRKQKSEQIKNIAHDVALNIDDSGIQDYIDDKVENTDYCIRVIDVGNNTSYVNENNRGVCGAIISNPQEVNSLYRQALQNGGEAIRISTVEIFNTFNDFDNNKDNPPNNVDDSKSMTYGEIANVSSGTYFVMVNSKITMLNEIKSTLKSQLIIITAMMACIALIIAFGLSRWISKPIIEINKSAKKLATGDFSVEFKGKGYLEIEELNETLNTAREELSKVENLRNELIANMSHDLRTPLTMIAGYGEVMRDLPGENTPENVQIIIDECHRLTNLVNDILDLSKIQSGTQSISLNTCNITSQTKDVVERFNKMLEKEGYVFTFDYDKEVSVVCDSIKMDQVLYNLLVNAEHYTGEDKHIWVKQEINNDEVTIKVIDSGEGIKEEDLPYVWDRYYKIDKVHKRNIVGSGLGLSIVKGILELHKAKYGVTSNSNGTTFYFTLKIKQD